MKLIIPKGCDNAPRKQIVIDFTVAILKKQNEIIKEYADESIIWYQLKDNKKIEGKYTFITALQDENENIIDYLEIYQVIADWEIRFNRISYDRYSLANNTKIDFCDVFTFSNTAKSGKIKEIKSYRL